MINIEWVCRFGLATIGGQQLQPDLGWFSAGTYKKLGEWGEYLFVSVPARLTASSKNLTPNSLLKHHNQISRGSCSHPTGPLHSGFRLS